MRIFVGSTSEVLKDDRFLGVCQWIEAAGHEVVRWDAAGLFPPGGYTWERLGDIARHEVDAAVLVFSPDDDVTVRGKTSLQPRDNVHLEYGLFCGILTSKNVAIVEMDRPKGASDLAGLITIRYPSGGGARAEREFVAWLNTLVERDRSVRADVSPLESPFQASGKESLFRKGSELLSSARNQVILVAKTPVIFMGPRPYKGRRQPFSYERDQYDLYRQVVEKCSEPDGPDFLCIASAAAVKKDVDIHGDSLLQKIKKNGVWLQEWTRRSAEPTKIRIEWMDNSDGLGYLVCDHTFMIWMKDEAGDSVWITAESEAVSNALRFQAECLADVAGAKPDWSHEDPFVGLRA